MWVCFARNDGIVLGLYQQSLNIEFQKFCFFLQFIKFIKNHFWGIAMSETSAAYTTALNPVTGEKLGQIPLDRVADLPERVQRARRAQEKWAQISVKDRMPYFYGVLQYLTQHTDELAETIARDTGKLRIDALAAEVLPAAMATHYYIRKAPKFLRTKKLFPANIAFLNKRSEVRRVPYGVLGIISPWNYPFAIPFSEVIMGLMAGNAVILKTASETQMVGQTLKQVFEAAELPKDLFQLVNIPGREAGPGFLQAGVDKLFFTGSVPVGKALMKLAADTLTPLNLELGGNDAMIVCADANLERAANGAIWAGLSNAGQSCGGVERIYVQRDIYAPFCELLKQKTERLRVGYDRDFEVDMGAITTERQMESIQKQIDDALTKGAHILAQSQLPGQKEWKNFMPATVLMDVTHDMDVMKHETFGPVLAVMPFDSEDQALKLANDSYLGLTGSVWSANRAKAKKLATQIKAGAVTINDHLMSHGLAETSWGGFNQSGIGRTHGEAGFMEMTQSQFIVDDWLGNLNRDLWWQPYSAELYNGLKGLLTGLFGSGPILRFKGWWALMKILPRMFKDTIIE